MCLHLICKYTPESRIAWKTNLYHFTSSGLGALPPKVTQNRHNRPIASHFHSGGLEFSYLGQDLDEADGESEETIARITVRERTAEHLHDVLSGD